MQNTQYQLLKTKRFLPLFITQFLNAFNDNVFKNALVILITYQITITLTLQQLLIALASGLFILPFFLFSATAGQLADKLEKTRLIQIIKFFEIILACLASAGFYFGNLYFLLFTLFLIGTHSSFFGPIKYAILPDHLRSSELIAGNALIEAGTFLAILIGSILGGILILEPRGNIVIPSLLISFAVLGWLSSLFIPKTTAALPSLQLNFNLLSETRRIIQYARQHKTIYLSILAISWFWLIGATLVSQFPIFVKNVLCSNASIVTLFFTIFSIGIAIGSLACNKLLKGSISTKYVPFGVFGMSVFLFDLSIAASFQPHSVTLDTLKQFLAHTQNIHILADVFLLSICAGFYVVPLYAIIQKNADEKHRARIIACNNILNALFMVFATLGIMLFSLIHFSVIQIFLLLATLNIFVALYACKLLPEAVLHSFLKWILKLCYRVQIEGIENYHHAGERVVIVANHISFLDAALLASFLPDKLTFAVNTQIAQKWWLLPITRLIKTFPLDPTNPFALKSLIKVVRENNRCVIFPEGRITVTGSLMKIYEGPGLIADQAQARLLPIRIDGSQYTRFSKLKNKIKLRWFPPITITIQPPCQFNIPDSIHGKVRRQLIGKQLYDIMSNLIFESSDYRKTLFTSLLEAQKIHSKRHEILEDVQRTPITYQQLIKHIFVLSNFLKKITASKEIVGILLPNMISNVVSFFALQAANRIPAMLNYTGGIKNLLSACTTCQIKSILTSRKFIRISKLQRMIDELQLAKIQIYYLEDIIKKISLANKLIGLMQSKFPYMTYIKPYSAISANEPAVILFTSGSEGTPKGVVLSHANIQANRFQLSARIDFNAQDKIFNALPMFHSFGLNAAVILPILSGIKTFLYPSPLHYRIVPELIYENDATITFGTDTFLRGYARYANAFDFYSIRYILAGAEKLRNETKDLWMQKFGIRILEGYGATETAPVMSTNTPMQYKLGSVGRFLPHIHYKLEAVPGIEQGGKLHVSGPNIMLGYMLNDQPGKINTLDNGWYDTGDIVSIDHDGFITIMGRAKRFAKIGGEMVSLTAIESYLFDLWPNHHHAIIANADDQKGEQIILITTHPKPNREELITFVKQSGINEISVPKKFISVEKLPLLATGKIDYPAVHELFGSIN